MKWKNYWIVLIGVLVGFVLAQVIMPCNAQAQELTGVLAIQSIPDKSHDHMSFEVTGYRVEDGNYHVWTGGAAWTLWKLTVGGGVAVEDRGGYDRQKALAVGSVLEVSDFVQVKVGYSQDPSALDKLGTVAVGLVWGF